MHDCSSNQVSRQSHLFSYCTTTLLAKSATANIYKPLLLGSNALYIMLLLGLHISFGIRNCLGILATWAFQAYSYIGILDQAANASTSSSSSNSSSSTTGGTSSNKKKSLVGGAHLDLLAITLVVQYGTVLHSTRWYWLLAIVPLWGGWTLYSTFFGKKGSTSTAAADTTTTPASDADADRRKKRAEKRRQKWSS
jgi:hypothetical protein